MKKGFTLIELLAVIVIIALIALVTIPLIGRVIENSKKGALTASASGVIEAAEIYYSTKMMENPETKIFMCSNEGCISGEEKLDYKGQISEGRVILYADGKVSICIEDGTNAALKLATQSEITTEEGSCNYESEDYSIDATISKTKYNELQEEMTNGKKSIATSITNKGIATSETATLEEMAANIDQIVTDSSESERNDLYQALQYSGLVTEDMTFEEMISILANLYPENLELIPLLTSNTSTDGIVISASSYYNSDSNGTYYAWGAFDNYEVGNYGKTWVASGKTVPQWLQIYFSTTKIVNKIAIYFDDFASLTTFVVQGSNDGNEWIDITESITNVSPNTLVEYEITKNKARYYYYRIYITTQTQTALGTGRIKMLQLYGS